jgi:hypothetical protein
MSMCRLMTNTGRSRRVCRERWHQPAYVEPLAWQIWTPGLAVMHQFTVAHYDAGFETAATVLPFGISGCCHEGASSQTLGHR